MQFRTFGGLLVMLLICCTLTASNKKDDKETSIAQKYKALQTQLKEGQQAIIEKLEKAEEEKVRNQLIGEYFGEALRYAPRFLALAKQDPKDDAAIAPLMFVLNNLGTSPEADAAADLIVKHHLDNEQVTLLTGSFGRSQSFGAEKVLRALAEKSEDKEVRGRATYALATHLTGRAEAVTQFKGLKGDRLDAIKSRMGETFLKRFQTSDSKKLNQEAEKLLAVVVEKYADVEEFGKKIGEQAKNELYAMKNLAVGKVAPEIEAEDIDGEKFKLSDYRGKVVLLDFWGNW